MVRHACHADPSGLQLVSFSLKSLGALAPVDFSSCLDTLHASLVSGVDFVLALSSASTPLRPHSS